MKKKLFIKPTAALRRAAVCWAALLSLTFTLVSCGGDDDDDGTEITDEPQTGDDGQQQQSIYTPEMFFGVWKLTESVTGSQIDVEDDPDSEWQRVFFTDEWDGQRGKGQTRLLTNGGFRFVSDYEWWLGYNNEIHIVDYDSGGESVHEVYFEDGGNTMLIYGYNGPSSFQRYVRVN